jgi:hypothetical protein
LVLLIATGAQSPAALLVSPARIDFGKQAVGSAGPGQTITISNSGTRTVSQLFIITSGIDFSQKNDCGQALAPGAKCTIQVLFKPVTIGERIGSLSIAAFGSGGRYLIVLNGTGEDNSEGTT